MLLASMLALVASPAAANPGDPRVLRGVLAWAPGANGPPVVVVRGNDGRDYVADLSAAQRRGEPVGIGDRISLVGVEGGRPWEMAAIVIGSGDSALAALSTSPASPSASPAMTTPAPTEHPAATVRPWRRIHGRVESVADKTLRLRDVDGRSVTVDASQLIGNVETVLRPGDQATVFVVSGDDQRLVAIGFVQTEGSEASALPRQPR